MGGIMVKIIVCILILMAFLSPCLYSGEYSVDKGSFMLSGNVSLSSALGDANSRSISERLHLSPSFTYFGVRNVGVGIELTFERIDFYDYDIKALAVGPGITYYIGGMNRGSYPFISAAFQGLFYDVKRPYTDDDGHGFQIKFGLGYLDMVTKHVAFTVNLEYLLQHISSHGPLFGGESGHALGLRIGLNYFIF
jgi:hypothetical protein